VGSVEEADRVADGMRGMDLEAREGTKKTQGG